MEFPIFETMARLLEAHSGYRRSLAYIAGDNGDGPTLPIVAGTSTAQPLSILLRDLVTMTPLDGARVRYRDADTGDPKSARVLSATTSGGTITLNLDQPVKVVDGSEVCIEWPE